MNDSFEFTLHSPLTKEDWNKITDAEYEHTNFVTFQTPQGRQVKYIKCDVLDKIRAEIEEERVHDDLDFGQEIYYNNAIDDVLKIIDKYKAEKEEPHGRTNQ